MPSTGLIVADPTKNLIPLTTPDKVKANLKLDVSLSPEDLAFLSTEIDAATSWVETRLNRLVASRAYTGNLDGNGKTVLYPEDADGRPLGPITELTSLSIDGLTIDVSSINEVLLYGEAGYLRLVNGRVFSVGYQNVALALKAGFTTVPPAIEFGVTELASQKWTNRDKKQDLVSLSTLGQTLTFRVEEMSRETRDALGYFIREVL